MKIIILDRDGVINYDSDDYIKSPDEWIPIPGSLEAVARLSQAGYILAVATNQSGVGRGLYTEATLQAIHEKMYRALHAVGGKIDALFYCPHVPDAHCACRKPEPGLLHQIAQHFKIDLKGILFIGDSMKDIQAAQRVGCQPVLLKTGNGAQTASLLSAREGILIYDDLSAAVEAILK